MLLPHDHPDIVDLRQRALRCGFAFEMGDETITLTCWPLTPLKDSRTSRGVVSLHQRLDALGHES